MAVLSKGFNMVYPAAENPGSQDRNQESQDYDRQFAKSITPFQRGIDEDEVIHAVSRLSNKLTRNSERLIESRFDISITEWRIIALLGQNHLMTMASVIQTRMLLANDVYVCAVKLQSRGLIEFDNADVYANACLTTSGRRIYDRVLPFMQERQKNLMMNMTPQGRINFMGLLQGFEEVVDAEYRTIGRSSLRFDELTDVVSGEDVF